MVWAVQTEHSLIWRIIVGGLIWATIGIGVPEGLRWIRGVEKDHVMRTPVTPDHEHTPISATPVQQLGKAEDTPHTTKDSVNTKAGHSNTEALFPKSHGPVITQTGNNNIAQVGDNNQATIVVPPQRHIRPEDREKLRKFLSENRGTVAIYAIFGDPESSIIADEWLTLLREAGWKADGIVQAVPDRPWDGVHITIHGEPVPAFQPFLVPNENPASDLIRALQQQDMAPMTYRKMDQAEGTMELGFGINPKLRKSK